MTGRWRTKRPGCGRAAGRDPIGHRMEAWPVGDELRRPPASDDEDRLRLAADQSATFRALLFRHGLAIYAQIQQTAGCNISHTVESRLGRCLLQTHDLSGSDKLVLTQESMAQMIGARRNSVSLVANTLQQANFIHYSRGRIEITDPDGLRKTACECYATVKAQYDRLLRPRGLS